MKRLTTPKGVTLVELMVVVAIISVLAAIATVAYGNYIRQGKLQRLNAIAMEIQAGQERYRSRNNRYFPATPGKVAYAGAEEKFQKLLDFATTVPPDMIIDTESWNAGGTCTICEGTGGDTTKMGFAVRVQQDMKNAGDGVLTTVVMHNQLQAPMVLNEGE